MGLNIHRKNNGRGVSYRVFSNGSGSYITNELNREELVDFLKKREILAPVDNILCSKRYEEELEEWINREDARIDWFSYNKESADEGYEPLQVPSPSSKEQLLKEAQERAEWFKKRISLLKWATARCEEDLRTLEKECEDLSK